MGVKQLWVSLQEAIKTLDRNNDLEQLVSQVDGERIAVDLSIWLLAAKKQIALHTLGMSEVGMCLKVVFERACNWVRHGIHPVFVVDGLSPAAKEETLRSRYRMEHGPSATQPDRSNRDCDGPAGWFGVCCREAARLLEAMGLPVVFAVGEAEAMCAAMNAAGLVSACASADVDVLLFGAQANYRRLHLQYEVPRNNQLELCELGSVRQWLGIQRGGTEALKAVGLLCGGDYASGADKVGQSKALEAVRCLLKGYEDDTCLLHRLRQALEEGPDVEILALDKCTGCKRCGHDSGHRSRCERHRKGCVECGTSGECVARAFEHCSCKFHRLTLERHLAKVLEAASSTPGFLQAFDVAAEAYAAGSRAAKDAVVALQREGFTGTWRRRPDLDAVADILGSNTVNWRRATVRDKLRPLIIEWDFRQGPNISGTVVWRPTHITKVSTNLNASWRYIVQLEHISCAGGSREDEDADRLWWQTEAGGADAEDDKTGSSGQQQQQQQQAGEAEEEEPAQVPRKQQQQQQQQAGEAEEEEPAHRSRSKGGAKQRTVLVRISLMKEAWPELVGRFEAAKAAAAAARAAQKEVKGRRGRAKAPEASAAQQSLMASVFKVVKNPPQPDHAGTARVSSEPLVVAPAVGAEKKPAQAAPAFARGPQKGSCGEPAEPRGWQQQQHKAPSARGPLDKFFHLSQDGMQLRAPGCARDQQAAGLAHRTAPAADLVRSRRPAAGQAERQGLEGRGRAGVPGLQTTQGLGITADPEGGMSFAQRLQAKKQAWQRSLEQQLTGSPSRCRSSSSSDLGAQGGPEGQQHAGQQAQQEHSPQLQREQQQECSLKAWQTDTARPCDLSPTTQPTSCPMQGPASPLSPCKRAPCALSSPSKRLSARGVHAEASSPLTGRARARLFGGGSQEQSCSGAQQQSADRTPEVIEISDSD